MDCGTKKSNYFVEQDPNANNEDVQICGFCGSKHLRIYDNFLDCLDCGRATSLNIDTR